MNAFLCPHCGMRLDWRDRDRMLCSNCNNEVIRDADYYALPKRPEPPASGTYWRERQEENYAALPPRMAGGEASAHLAALAESRPGGDTESLRPVLMRLATLPAMQSAKAAALSRILASAKKGADAEEVLRWLDYITEADISDESRMELYAYLLEQVAGVFTKAAEAFDVVGRLEELPLIGADDGKKALIETVIFRCVDKSTLSNFFDTIRLLELVRRSGLFFFDEEKKYNLFKQILLNYMGELKSYRDGKVVLEYIRSMRLKKSSTARMTEAVLNRNLPGKLSVEAYADYATYLLNPEKRFKFLFGIFLRTRGDLSGKAEYVSGLYREDLLSADDVLLYLDSTVILARKDGGGMRFSGPYRELAEEFSGAVYSHEAAEACPDEMGYLAKSMGTAFRAHREHTPESCPDDRDRKRRGETAGRRGTDKRGGALSVLSSLLLAISVVFGVLACVFTADFVRVLTIAGVVGIGLASGLLALAFSIAAMVKKQTGGKRVALAVLILLFVIAYLVFINVYSNSLGIS